MRYRKLVLIAIAFNLVGGCLLIINAVVGIIPGLSVETQVSTLAPGIMIFLAAIVMLVRKDYLRRE